MIPVFRAGDKDAVTLVATATAAFRVGPMRGGNDRIVAVPLAAVGPESADRDRAARLAALGEPLTLGEMDDWSVELTVIRERTDRF